MEGFRTKCPRIGAEMERAEEALKRAGGNGGRPVNWLRYLQDSAPKQRALFAKEIVGQLLRQKLVVLEEGRAVLAGRLEDAEIPASAGDLIASRIDALSPPERVVLEVAGSCGRAFEKEVLAEVTGIEDELLSPVLERLEELKLLRPTRDDEAVGECDYVFRNNLSWEVCCRGVLEARSREFHNRIGEALERLKSAKVVREFIVQCLDHFRCRVQNSAAAGDDIGCSAIIILHNFFLFNLKQLKKLLYI